MTPRRFSGITTGRLCQWQAGFAAAVTVPPLVAAFGLQGFPGWSGDLLGRGLGGFYWPRLRCPRFGGPLGGVASKVAPGFLGALAPDAVCRTPVRNRVPPAIPELRASRMDAAAAPPREGRRRLRLPQPHAAISPPVPRVQGPKAAFSRARLLRQPGRLQPPTPPPRQLPRCRCLLDHRHPGPSIATATSSGLNEGSRPSAVPASPSSRIAPAGSPPAPITSSSAGSPAPV